MPHDNVHDGLPCPRNGHDGDGTDSIVGGPNDSLLTPASRPVTSFSILVPVRVRSRDLSLSEAPVLLLLNFTQAVRTIFVERSPGRKSRWCKLTGPTCDYHDGRFESSRTHPLAFRWRCCDVSPLQGADLSAPISLFLGTLPSGGSTGHRLEQVDGDGSLSALSDVPFPAPRSLHLRRTACPS